MLIPLKHKTITIWCGGNNPPTITINEYSVCRQLVIPRMTSKSDMSMTLRTMVSRIPEISNSQPQHILSTLTLAPRRELTCSGSSKVSTSKPKSFSPASRILYASSTSLLMAIVVLTIKSMSCGRSPTILPRMDNFKPSSNFSLWPCLWTHGVDQFFDTATKD